MDMLDTTYPPVSNVSYAKAETLGEPGAKKLRLGMLGVHPDCGNSCMMVNDDAETLVQLTVYGFRTEAGKMIGAKIASLAQVHNVWRVKGWKRSIAALVVAIVVA